MTRAEIHAHICGYDPLTLAEWYVELSASSWPDDAPIPKPDGFDEGECTTALSRLFFETLKDLIVPEDVSFVRWVSIDGKPASEWAVWWDAYEAQKEPAVCAW